VAAVASNDVGAVGYYDAGGGQGEHTLTLHWTGSAWSIVPSPNVGLPAANRLYAVAARTGSDVWAVGTSVAAGRPLALHWDGQGWTLTTPPLGPNTGSWLAGVTMLSATNVWAVGAYSSISSPSRTLVEHYAGACAGAPP
jgi:hypothetical protein